MRIYLIRHADPYYPTDSLTPAGQREAQALADHLAGLGLDEIYASPRGRAQQTAQATATRLGKEGAGLPITTLDWTTELDGIYSEEYQRSLWDLDGALLRGPQILAGLDRWQSVAPLDHPRLAEHIERIRAGSDAFLRAQGFERDGPLYHFTHTNRKQIAIFAHLGFGLTWLSHLLAIPLPLVWAGFYLHPSSITTILFDERTPGVALPRVLGMGDLSHLHRAGLPPSPAGIIANYD